MRRREATVKLDPRVVRELEDLERQLAPIVRADAPRLDPLFADRLDARVAALAGPAPPARAVRHTWLARRRSLAYAGTALGAAAALAIAVTVGSGGSGAGHPAKVPPVAEVTRGPSSAVGVTVAPASTTAAGSIKAAAAPAGAASAAARGAQTAVTAPVPAPTPQLPATSTREVQRAATLSITVPPGRVQPAADRVVATTERLGGIVQDSNVATGSPGSGQASFDLLIPAAQLDTALAQLSALGHVAALNQSTQDITDQVGAARRSLSQSEAERTSLLRQLAKATTPNQVASIHQQLALVSGRIAADEQTLGAVLRRARYATVALTVSDGGAGVVPGHGGGWPLDTALRDARDVLGAVLGGVVVALAVLVPCGLAVALAWGGAAAIRRRRRERVLGAV